MSQGAEASNPLTQVPATRMLPTATTLHSPAVEPANRPAGWRLRARQHRPQLASPAGAESVQGWLLLRPASWLHRKQQSGAGWWVGGWVGRILSSRTYRTAPAVHRQPCCLRTRAHDDAQGHISPGKVADNASSAPAWAARHQAQPARQELGVTSGAGAWAVASKAAHTIHGALKAPARGS